MIAAWRDLQAVVLDIDGTLLDSADGIVAGFRHALESVGVTPPDDTTPSSPFITITFAPVSCFTSALPATCWTNPAASPTGRAGP